MPAALLPVRGLSEDAADVVLRQAQRETYQRPGYRPPKVDVARLRRRLNLSQTQFARRIGISVHTLRHWEYGDRKPRRSAQIMLGMIDRNVAVAMRLLRRRAWDRR